MKQKIIIHQDLNLEQLQKEIDLGGRFIVYQYCLSILFAITLRRFSTPTFIPNGSDITQLKKKYNLISSIFGWWGIPWGPIHTINSIRVNNKGGIDVTNDIMHNMTESSLFLREIDFLKVSEIFQKPINWDLKGFNKSVKVDFEMNPAYREIVAGLFINTEEHVEPHYVIGINARIDFEEAVIQVKTSLYKEFRKSTFFEFIDLTNPNELTTMLQNQGLRIV